MTTCKRPSCPRDARRGYRGLCVKHHRHDQRRRVASGELIEGFVPAQEAVDHIDMLIAHGMSQRRIAQAAGVYRDTITDLRVGKSIRATTMAKLRSVTIGDASRPDQDCGYVSAIGSARRLRALVAQGHSVLSIMPFSGLTKQTMGAIINGDVDVIYINTASQVRAAFNKLQVVVPPPSRGATACRNKAKKNGWHPPLAWDEDTIDDPLAEPLNPKRPKSEEWIDTYWELRDMGLVEERVAERLGISDEALATRLRRLEKKAA